MAEACNLGQDPQSESMESFDLVFEDLELRKAYQGHFSKSLAMAVDLEDGRPAKRLRLSDSTPAQNRSDGTTFLASELSRLLSIPLPHGFASLHETAA